MAAVRAFWVCVGVVVLTAAVAADPEPRPQIQPGALAQLDALRQLKQSRSPVQEKIGSRLYLALLARRQDPRLAPLKDFRFVRPEFDGRVPVEVIVRDRDSVPAVWAELQRRDAPITSSKRASFGSQIIAARLRLEDLESVAALGSVSRIRQPIRAVTRKVNTSEGDATHGAAGARGYYATSGAGVKVCVLSDGVDSLAAVQASGDLPAGVDVLTGQAGSGDEGTAMLEIIHDLAPGAALGFATAFGSEGEFAQNILDLADDGCNIIVDDILYLDESPFEDGPLAQAVNTVTANGVLYFSSAGNEGNKNDGTSGTWEGNFLASLASDPGPLSGRNLHDFGDGGNSIQVTAGSDNTMLIWAEHYGLSSGDASTDFDLYLMNAGLTTVLDSSTDRQNGTGLGDIPLEIIGVSEAGERLLVDKHANGSTSSVPMLNLIVFGGELEPALATAGATRGHGAAVNAFSVAATPAVSPGPYPGLFTSADNIEPFSSDGPRRIILSPNGSELTPGNRTATGGTVRLKPDLTAADGVATAAPGFDPFYGTSAAAPHAAAIAALLKSALPNLTPAQIRGYLTGSALDIEGVGVDRDSGAGIVMPGAALAAAGVTPVAHLAAGTAVFTQMIGDDDAFIEPNERWRIALPLSNDGGADATSITTVLGTSSANVTIRQGSSGYPNLAANATGINSRNFIFDVGSTFSCGGMLTFSLVATYSGGPASPQSFDFSAPTGQPTTPMTFAYTTPAVPIPDGTGFSGANPGAPASASVVAHDVVGRVSSVKLSLDGAACSSATGVGIEHTFVSDLELTLISPSGTAVKVIDNTDGSGDNFCQTVLDDASTGGSIQAVKHDDAPFTGSFEPASPLSKFGGESPTGSWSLHAQDFLEDDTGNIRKFSVTVAGSVCNAPPLDTNGPSVTINQASGQGDPAATSPVVFDVLFSEATGEFDAADVLLSGTALPTTAVIAGGPSAYTVSVSGMTANGTVVASVVADAIRDAGDNPSNPSTSTDNTVTFQGFTPNVGFTTSTQSVTEGTGAGSTTVTVTATLSQSSTLTVTAPFSVNTGSTATGGGTDYSLAASQFSFAPGAVSDSFLITITRDSTFEPDKTLVLDLGAPTNATVGVPATQTITIRDDDAAVANNIAPPPFDEDTSSTITLSYTDGGGGPPGSCAVPGVSNVTVSTACACNSGVCTVGITGNSNYNGPASFTYTVSSAGQTSNTATASLTINPVNDAPAIGSSAPATATEGVPYNYGAVNTDPDGPTQAWSLLGSHTCGGSIGASTGAFSFTPASPHPPASCVVAIQVCDGATPNLCATETTTVSITDVNVAPAISSAAPTTATEGVTYTYRATRTDSDGPGQIWSLPGTHTCGGSIVAGSGVFTFMPGPTPPPSCVVSVRVCDGGSPNLCDTQSTTVSITSVNSSPAITSTAPASATEDSLYTYSATRSDADGPGQTWSLLGSHTCGGSITVITGIFTFTPAGPVPAANCVVAIQVCDGGSPNLCATQTTTIGISAVNDAPFITSTPPAAATEDQAYAYAAVNSDADGPGQTWSLASAHTCGGAINTGSGEFSFTPQAPVPASCVVAVQVCDGGSPELCALQTATVALHGVKRKDSVGALGGSLLLGFAGALAWRRRGKWCPRRDSNSHGFTR